MTGVAGTKMTCGWLNTNLRVDNKCFKIKTLSFLLPEDTNKSRNLSKPQQNRRQKRKKSLLLFQFHSNKDVSKGG